MARMRIKDIAKRAGVSPSTVSKFLNGHYEAMAAATRARIADVIDRTGYRPSSVARNLRLDRSRTLGVILADIRNPYSSAMLAELSAQAAAADYTLTCAISDNDPAAEAEGIERLMGAGADGLIVNTCGGNDALLADVRRRAPVALLDRDTADGAIDLVTSNNAELGAALAREVSRGGAATCWLLTEHNDTSSVRRERAARFETEIGELGAAGDSIALASDARAAGEQLRELSRNAAGAPVGLIAVNGLVFERLVEALAVSKLDVGGLTRIATFDEYPWNGVLFGGVTTAAQNTHAIATAILRLIIGRIAGNAGRTPQTPDETGRGGSDQLGAEAAGAKTPRSPAPRRVRIEISGRLIARRSTRRRP